MERIDGKRWLRRRGTFPCYAHQSSKKKDSARRPSPPGALHSCRAVLRHSSNVTLRPATPRATSYHQFLPSLTMSYHLLPSNLTISYHLLPSLTINSYHLLPSLTISYHQILPSLTISYHLLPLLGVTARW